MKLSHDCVRDMLLYLEDNLYDKPLKIRSIASDFEKDYTLDEIVYTFQKLQQEKFITTTHETECSKHSSIKSITWKGHNLLDNIRDTKVLSIAKKALSAVPSFSIELLSNTCSKIIEGMAAKKL